VLVVVLVVVDPLPLSATEESTTRTTTTTTGSKPTRRLWVTNIPITRENAVALATPIQVRLDLDTS
jgi:hypothetical protein